MEPITTAELIARIVGPIYAIVSLGLLFSPDTYRKITVQFFEQSALSYLGGILALAMGVAILTFHFVWRADWTLLVTVLGCLATAKGAALTMAPKWMLGVWQPLLDRPGLLRVGGLAGLALGLFLAAKGYGVF